MVDKGQQSNMINLGFNLSKTQLLSETEEIESPIAGLKLVFTGNIPKRDDMKKNALNLGAEIQRLLWGILICGENVGSTKSLRLS